MGGGRGWLLGSRAGADQGGAARAGGAAGQRGDVHVGLVWEGAKTESPIGS